MQSTKREQTYCVNYQRRNSLINAFSWFDTVIPNVLMIWKLRRLFGINKMANGKNGIQNSTMTNPHQGIAYIGAAL